ncbi:MAG TPA: NADH-quinone oxidoreductase subunit NuoK [Bacteroidetes bacterium]|nr:NADH-quinone oxidoreductase subunit NuoK [Bacteroidota bacterium]
MNAIPIEYYLILSGILFAIGILGVIIRRNTIVIFMAIEIMLNSVNLTFIAFSSYLGDISGQIFVFFIMAVAAAESAIGLAIILALFRKKQTIYVDEVNTFKN